MRALWMIALFVVPAHADDEADCKKGKAKACAAIADEAADAGEVERAFEHYQLACKGRSMPACWEVGGRLIEGRGVDKDEKAGVALYERACRANEPRACNSLGTMWSAGKYGARVDHAKAKPLYEKSCRLKSGLACFNLGNVFRLGEGMDADPKKAVPHFKKACDLGEAKGCTELGIIYYEGKAVTKDRDRAVELFDKGCKLGSEIACKNHKAVSGK